MELGLRKLVELAPLRTRTSDQPLNRTDSEREAKKMKALAFPLVCCLLLAVPVTAEDLISSTTIRHLNEGGTAFEAAAAGNRCVRLKEGGIDLVFEAYWVHKGVASQKPAWQMDQASRLLFREAESKVIELNRDPARFGNLYTYCGVEFIGLYGVRTETRKRNGVRSWKAVGQAKGYILIAP